MTGKRRQFTKDFTLQVLREIETATTLAQAVRAHQLHPNPLAKWRQQ